MPRAIEKNSDVRYNRTKIKEDAENLCTQKGERHESVSRQTNL